MYKCIVSTCTKYIHQKFQSIYKIIDYILNYYDIDQNYKIIANNKLKRNNLR